MPFFNFDRAFAEQTTGVYLERRPRDSTCPRLLLGGRVALIMGGRPCQQTTRLPCTQMVEIDAPRDTDPVAPASAPASATETDRISPCVCC